MSRSTSRRSVCGPCGQLGTKWRVVHKSTEVNSDLGERGVLLQALTKAERLTDKFEDVRPAS